VVLAPLVYAAPIHAQSLCGGLDGRTFTDEVTQIEVQASTEAQNLRDLTGENEEAGLQVWDDAIKALTALDACNE
jgi:hypothetical protein